jgi:hypothetical protein
MNPNSGINPVLILLVFGPIYCSGKNQRSKKVIKRLKKDLHRKYCSTKYTLYIYYRMNILLMFVYYWVIITIKMFSYIQVENINQINFLIS